MTAGAVHGSVRLWLRLEGLVVLVLAVYLYARGAHSWVVFATLFFLPDISFAGYLAGPRVGAAVYNVAHSYVGPLLLAVALLTTEPLLCGRLSGQHTLASTARWATVSNTRPPLRIHILDLLEGRTAHRRGTS